MKRFVTVFILFLLSGFWVAAGNTGSHPIAESQDGETGSVTLEIKAPVEPVVRLTGTRGNSDSNPFGSVEFWNTEANYGFGMVLAKIAALEQDGFKNNARIAFYTASGNATDPGTLTERMTITDVGGVGIALPQDNDPQAYMSMSKLTVNGGIRLLKATDSAGSTSSSAIVFNDPSVGADRLVMRRTATGNNLAIDSWSGSAWMTPFTLLSANGHVGIGTTAPSEALHVVGNIRQSALAGTGTRIVCADSNGTLTLTDPPLVYGEFESDIVTINGKLGIGTKTPGYPVEIVRTGTNSSIVLNRTDGARNFMNANASFGNIGTANNYPLRLVVNSLGKMTLNSDNSLNMASGATCTAGGVWTNASSIALKENISTLNSDEAATTLQALNPVKYNYKAENDQNHVGFIAEEVPELVAMKDRKSLSPMDIVAVLTRVTQDQQQQLQEQKQINENLSRKMQEQQQLTQAQQMQFQNQQHLTQKQLQEQQQINEEMKMEIAELKKKRSE
jgi:hypothetical protein